MLRDGVRTFWSNEDWLLRVTDKTGLIFFLQFTATIAAAGGGSRLARPNFTLDPIQRTIIFRLSVMSAELSPMRSSTGSASTVSALPFQ